MERGRGVLRLSIPSLPKWSSLFSSLLPGGMVNGGREKAEKVLICQQVESVHKAESMGLIAIFPKQNQIILTPLPSSNC